MLGETKVSRSSHVPLEGRIFGWNAQLFYVAAKKCLLFTNKATLYSVVKFNILKRDFFNFPALFNVALADQLSADGVDAKAAPFQLPSDVQLVRTDNDKKVIGSMNDFIFQLKVALAHEVAGFVPPDNCRAGSYLNGCIMKYIGYKTPIECLAAYKLDA